MSLTDKAVVQIRERTRTGALPPGSKLPPEPELAAQLGLSRNHAREAVKALSVVRVLEVRRGDGTYVTSLAPRLLFEGLGGAVELLQSDPGALLDLMEVRRLLEPAATSLAATRISEDQLAEIEHHLDAMREARDDVERLNAHDAAFHWAVVRATGNESLPPCSKASPAALCAPASGGASSATRPRSARSASTRRSSRLSPTGTRPWARPPYSCMSATTERWMREHLRTAEAATPSIEGPGLLTRPDPA